MEITDKKDNQITFKADINESLANAIRRYVNQVPVLAIDEVEIIKNGSALYDEVVAHRLGLIPLKMDKAISAKNPGKLKLVSKNEGMVHSSEIQGNVEVVFGDIPVTYLDKGQEMELLATTKAGVGDDHVKYSPGLMYYRNLSEITMDKGFLEEIKRTCPDANVKEKGDKIVVSDDQAKEVLDVCEGIGDKAGTNVEVEFNPGLMVTIESFGQMPTNDIFIKAADALKKDLAEISKKIK